MTLLLLAWNGRYDTPLIELLIEMVERDLSNTTYV